MESEVRETHFPPTTDAGLGVCFCHLRLRGQHLRQLRPRHSVPRLQQQAQAAAAETEQKAESADVVCGGDEGVPVGLRHGPDV